MPPSDPHTSAELARVFKTYSDMMKAMDSPVMPLASVFMWLLIMALVMYLSKVRPRDFQVSLLLGLTCLFSGSILGLLPPTLAGWMGAELAKPMGEMSGPPASLVLKSVGSIAIFLSGLVIFFVGLVRAKGKKDRGLRSSASWGPPPKA